MGWFDDNAYPNNPALNQFQAGQYAQPTDSGGQATPGGGFDERSGFSASTPGLAPSAPASGSGAPSSGNPTDPTYFRQQLVQWAQQNNRPDVARDPDYWVNAYMKGGGWDNAGNTNALIARIQGTDASGNEPGRSGAAGSLGSFMGNGSPLLAPYTGSAPAFSAPSGLSMANDPGYQARMQMGTQAIERSAASKGTLLTGGTLKDLAAFGQDYGSNEYGNVFNRALQTQNANMGTFNANYDVFRNNQTDPFNKLFSVTGLGLNAAQGANAAGANYGSQIGQNTSGYVNLATGSGQRQGDLTQAGGYYGASGTVGQTNAYTKGAGSIADWYAKYLADRDKSKTSDANANLGLGG